MHILVVQEWWLEWLGIPLYTRLGLRFLVGNCWRWQSPVDVPTYLLHTSLSESKYILSLVYTNIRKRYVFCICQKKMGTFLSVCPFIPKRIHFGCLCKPGTDVMIFKYFCRKILQKYWRFVLKLLLVFKKKFIITLVFEKNANFFTENWQKSQKIVIVTSTPCFTDSREKQRNFNKSSRYICMYNNDGTFFIGGRQLFSKTFRIFQKLSPRDQVL
jgi:hypothetical protein